MRTFLKLILGVEEYEEASAAALLRFTLASDRFTVAPWFVHFYEHFFFLYCLILFVCLFVSSLIFQFFICVVPIWPDLWPSWWDFISLTFNPSIIGVCDIVGYCQILWSFSLQVHIWGPEGSSEDFQHGFAKGRSSFVLKSTEF
jgi:hypothetical protein